MSANTEIAEREAKSQAAQQRARAPESSIRAPVDIYEDSEGITVEADMPGVSRDRLHVRVEAGHLLVEGHLQFELPEKAEALYADVRSTVYRRSFVLGRELDTEKIQANLKDGVLKVRIPKRAELKPRKIEVRVS